jgi:plastocyanin
VKRLVVLAVLALLVAVAASTALGRNARPNAPAACAKGAVAARIGGKAVCLHPRMACKAAYNRIYKRHGFSCVAGHLRKTPAAKPKPKPPAPTPTTPEPPYTPPTGTVGTANTTVTVELRDAVFPGSIVLSQTTIPSGTVTFVIMNKCINGPCSFDLQGVKAGAILNNTGQSETWTVALAPGTYRYHCDVDPNMKGSFTVTP